MIYFVSQVNADGDPDWENLRRFDSKAEAEAFVDAHDDFGLFCTNDPGIFRDTEVEGA